MVREFSDYMPADRGITSRAEIMTITEHFGLDKMSKLELQNLRDFVVLHGEGNTLHKMVGYSSEIATSLANAMVYDEDVRAVVLAAYQMYIDYEAEKLAPKIAPIIKQAEEMLKSLSTGSAAASEAQQVSFKKRLS